MPGLKEKRIAVGLTQAQMAAKVGVSLTSYRMWEYGVKPAEHNRRKVEEVLRDAAESRQTD